MKLVRGIHRIVTATVLGLALVFTATSCGVDPSDLSLPGSGVDGPTYTVDIAFADALNLPARARVMANGVQIGQVRQVSVIDPTSSTSGSVIVKVDIAESARISTSAIAQLRQDTLLGDIYIGLDTAPTAQDAIAAGGRIPLEQTEPALQVEDMLSGLATFVSGGALHSAQNIVERVNAALPPQPAETARIADVLKGDLIDIAANQEGITDFLDSVDGNAQMLLDNQVLLDQILTPQGVVDVTEIAKSLINVIGVVGALGGIAHSLAWLGPLIREGDAAARAFVPMLLNDARPLNLSAPSNLERLTKFLTEKLLPWSQRPTVNIAGVRVTNTTTSPTSPADQTTQIIDILRMIGMVR
jgi:phospholipid/cholesterol/gamma-HCH transport system substrate-binding protein